MSAKAVYLRDLVEEVPDSVPPPPSAQAMAPALLPPPPLSSVRGRKRGKPFEGTLEMHRGTWSARFVVVEGGRRVKKRVSLHTTSLEVAEKLLLEMRDGMVKGRKLHTPQEPGPPITAESVVSRRTHPSEYASWKLAARRCTSPQDQNWPYYGGRGIRFHEAWTGENGFKQFLLDMGPKPTRDHVLGRRRKNGHIDPDNALWMLRGDARVGVRKNYNTGVTTTRFVPLLDWPGRHISQVRISERNNLLKIEGVEGGLTPNEADELARQLVCVADAMRMRRSVNDAAR